MMCTRTIATGAGILSPRYPPAFLSFFPRSGSPVPLRLPQTKRAGYKNTKSQPRTGHTRTNHETNTREGRR